MKLNKISADMVSRRPDQTAEWLNRLARQVDIVEASAASSSKKPGDLPIATTYSLGVVKIGQNLSITPEGVLSALAPTSYNYELLFNKPKINSVELIGNKSLSDLGIDIPTKTSELLNDGSDGTSTYVELADLATVATSGAYADLSGKPTNLSDFNNDVGYITSADLPTKTSELLNDGADGTSTYVEHDELATVATSGSYTDLINKPTIGNATLTIQKNSTNVGTFTANATSNKTIDISVPTQTSDIVNNGADGTSTYVEADDLATVATSGSYSDLLNKPTIGNATLTIQKNGTSAGTFTANATSNKTINITVPTTAADVGALPDSTKYAANLSLTIDSSTFVVTGQLKDQDGNNLGSAQTVDLPLESVVVSGSYDSATKEVVLVLENGSEIRFSVADLVSGLQAEITSANPLDADLVDDSTSTNKFVTSSDITTWNGKQDALTAGSNIQINGTTISATDTTYSAGSGISLNGTTFSADTSVVQEKLTAGSNIQINGATISATDTTYTAGTGLNLNGTQFSVDTTTIATKTDLPTKTSDLVNDGADNTSVYVEADELATVATSGSYSDLSNKPTIGNATLTIQKNGTNVQTFTANATSNKTANITVPTKTSDITNDGADGTSTYVENDDLTTALAGKQDVLTAGTNINIASNTISTQTRGIEYIVGTQASATNLWTGVSTDDGCSSGTLYVGKTIAYYLPVAGNNSAATLNLTLPDGTTTGQITLRRTGNGNVTTHFGANNVIVMTYDGSYWKVSAYYDSTNTSQLRNYNSVKAASAISNDVLTGGTDAGYVKLVDGATFDITYPLLWFAAGSSLSAGGTSSAFWHAYDGRTLRNNKSGWTGTAYQLVYLVGTLSGTTFTVSSDVFTQTAPTTDDGKTYVPIGVTYSTYQIYYYSTNEYWQYKNGAFRPISHSEPVMTGADSGTAGTAGLVPAPAAGDNTKYLSGDGTWKTVSQYALPIASASELGGVKIGSRLTINSSTGVLSADSQTDNNFTTTLKNKLDGIAAGAEVNVQSDWTEASNTSDAYIKNKPSLATVATSGSYNDLTNKPTIPAAQVNSDWNANSGVAQILNKPSLATVATSGSYNDLTNKPTIPTVNNGTLTIQKNGTNVQTFTANQSTNATANIAVPTKTSDITNDSGFITSSSLSSYLPLAGGTMTGATYGYFPATASTMVGNEYNILLNGGDRYTITQSGTGLLTTAQAKALFDGKLAPQYSSDGVDPDDPYVLLVEGLPNTHTQTGGVFGWTCRYYVPTTFKVELYDNYNSRGWVTIAQKTNTATKELFVDLFRTAGVGGGAYTKIRITIYDSNGAVGANGHRKWGISEIFFCHPEAISAYEYASVDKANTATKATQDANGDVIDTTYAKLTDLPTVNNATLTIQKNGSTVKTFTANASSNVTANITVPTKTSDLTNDSGFVTDTTSQNFAAQEGSTNPVFDDMTPVRTIEWDVSDTTYRPIYQMANTGWTYINMDITVAYRITVTGSSIHSVTDVVDRWHNPASWPITSMMCRTLSNSAATTGLKYLRAIYPVAAYLNNATYPLGVEIEMHNSTARHVKIEVFKDSAQVTWNTTKPAGPIYVSSTYNGNRNLEVYGTRGWRFYQPTQMYADTSNRANYISDFEAANWSAGEIKSGATALVAGHYAFLAEDGLVYDVSNTVKPIATGEAKFGFISNNVNANTAISWTYWRTITRPSATQVNYIPHDNFALGDRIYLRCTVDSNGKVYSDNYLSKTMSAGYTWMPFGWGRNTTQIYVDTRFPMFYTLDSSGRLVRVNGKPTGIEQAAFVGNTLSPAPNVFVYTNNIADGAVTADKISKPSLLDFFYPVGSYYETSDITFNPNNSWGGTWVEDTAGRVLVAKDSGTFSTVGDTGGSEYMQQHNHDLRWASYDGKHVLMSYSAGSEASYNLTYSSVNAVIPSSNIMTGQPKNVLNNTDMTTGESGNLQPYIVIKRWHRTA